MNSKIKLMVRRLALGVSFSLAMLSQVGAAATVQAEQAPRSAVSAQPDPAVQIMAQLRALRSNDVQALLKHFDAMKKMMGKFGDIQDMAKKLPDAGQLTPEQLANPQAFMPNPNRIFTTREDKDAMKKYRDDRKKKKQLAKKSRR